MRAIAQWSSLHPEELGILTDVSALSHGQSEQIIEGSIGNFPLPLGFAAGFLVDGHALAVPMATDQPGVVAGTSRGAGLAALGGGFRTEVREPVMVGQVELRHVKDPRAGRAALLRRSRAWVNHLNSLAPSMVARGGGVKRIECHVVGEWRLVMLVHVDVRDALGASIVKRLCAELGPMAAEVAEGQVGVCQMSNFVVERLVAVRATFPLARAVLEEVVARDLLAHEDMHAAVTMNKTVFDAVDGVLVATGNDWRAVEAAGHAFASRGGRYDALARLRKGKGSTLEASLLMPMPVATVGGITHSHPTAKVVHRVLGQPDAKRLASIVASAGLARVLGSCVA